MSNLEKHAYLIMAHNNFYILEKLLLLLDDIRNDIYIHIDRKVSDFDFAHFKTICIKSHVIFTKKRINVQWGTQSQVKTELLLYESSFINGPYEYYHLLSGVDLPLKSQNEIHYFFSENQCEYIYNKPILSYYDIARVSRFHFFVGSKAKLLKLINVYINRIQDLFNIDRTKHILFPVKRGSNWCDLTHNAVEILLQNKKEILNMTRFSICADEIYKQTFLQNQELDIVNNDLRLIDWSRSQNGNNPHIYTIDDWNVLISSDKLFARKFDISIDKNVVDKLFEYVKNK